MDRVKGKFLVRRDTTENWNEKRGFIPMRGEVIIYTDHGKVTDDLGNEVNVPAIKVGDGDAYLVDLPFVGADERFEILNELRTHTSNTVIHVSQEDRDFWDAKLNCDVDGTTLILNRT